MPATVTPLIRVQDIRATIDWYKTIGFKVINTDEEYGGELNWAMLSFGEGYVMLNSGGQPTADDRREVDLYIHTDNVDDLYRHLNERIEVRKGPHDTFYGMREFILRDINGYWVTFGQDLDDPTSQVSN